MYYVLCIIGDVFNVLCIMYYRRCVMYYVGLVCIVFLVAMKIAVEFAACERLHAVRKELHSEKEDAEASEDGLGHFRCLCCHCRILLRVCCR